MFLDSEVNPAVLTQLFQSNPIATIVFDVNHRITHWNRACEVLTGVPADKMLGSLDAWQIFYPQPRPLLADLVIEDADASFLANFYQNKLHKSKLIEHAYEAEGFFPNVAGGCWLLFSAVAVRDQQGRIIGAIETLQDITSQRRTETALRNSEAYLSQIVDGFPVATLVINAEHHVTHWNKACELLTGILAEDMITTTDPWRAFYTSRQPILADLILDQADPTQFESLPQTRFRPSSLITGGYEAERFFPQLGKDGLWLFFIAVAIHDTEGKIVGAIETLQDITERRRTEDELRQNEELYRQLSQTDALTGLLNSRSLHERLQFKIEYARTHLQPLSLMVLDCDDFKAINDTYGHQEGDKVLQKLASIIKNTIPDPECAFRYGGEEFVVLLTEHLDTACLLAEKIRFGFEDARVTAQSGNKICCTVSIGVARLYPNDSSHCILRRADEACYASKHNGKNCIFATR